ncbi:hypothetical protein [Granulosicoccus antarcticus]|uniref:Uncharacterized protein n=1 Tax=Granulosicoccus antarcticus IMCC3135 TaxID=1192854 RepID=A0A2Z2NN92_9GAMM|nr:hypothetical protein [Granulosicoccus antarcticus]ASJ71391.1 hypothetical protein IMCC3135_06420 [Granulosicoccus antarcticus IMCC3135]
MITTWMWVLFLIATLTGCGGSSGEPPAGTQPLIPDDDSDVVVRSDIRDVDKLFVYRSDSPYAPVLKECALIDEINDGCTLEVLPFITQASPVFTKEDILDRLLVTHDWMGERFEALLNEAPEYMIPLFGSLTSIVIGSTVRPSNYWIGTGGIQLDPANLWLSIEEKANVSIVDDFRSDFGKELQFWDMASLRIDGRPAIQFFSLSSRQERTFKDILIPVYRLLYHELAHAMDYLPVASIASLDSSLVPAEALSANSHYFLSPQLYLDLPLYSQVLYDLAQVSFQGGKVTDVQKNLTPLLVGSEMAIDGALEYYGYNTWREDLATLFTAVMMKKDFEVDYFLAFVDKPKDESEYSCSELTVGWGVKNRLADPLVAPRAKWVVDSIYGSSAQFDDFFANQLGEAVAMTEGLDWCANRDVDLQFTTTHKSNLSLDNAVDRQLQLNGERQIHTH